jgi:hypothetical protein
MPASRDFTKWTASAAGGTRRGGRINDENASNTEYLDRNYGGVLIIFGPVVRYVRPGAAANSHHPGLAHPIGSDNPIKIAFHEWMAIAADVRAARTWRERLRQVFGRPDEALLLVEKTRA